MLTWMQGNILAAIAAAFTLIFIVYSLLERDHSVRLSKKYRSSIFEAQSKIFLNATQYLISGNKDLAIKEFLNAVNLNRETIETYFALGGLFRSNGEIEKSISVHRSLIARDNISESIRIKALKELAQDFDKGGFLDKALETYKDVLKINRDQVESIQAICRIYESIGDWDQAYNYRIMLSKVGNEDQSLMISHILVEKAKTLFAQEKFGQAQDELEDAFRFFPSVSAKILQLKLYLVQGNFDDAKGLFPELLKEHPMFASFVFISLDEFSSKNVEMKERYTQRLSLLRDYFVGLDDKQLFSSPALVLVKIRLLKDIKEPGKACELLSYWLKNHQESSDVLRIEYIKLLIDLQHKDQALEEMRGLLEGIYQDQTRHFCGQCGYNSDDIFWRCPQCHVWESIQFRMKV